MLIKNLVLCFIFLEMQCFFALVYYGVILRGKPLNHRIFVSLNFAISIDMNLLETLCSFIHIISQLSA